MNITERNTNLTFENNFLWTPLILSSEFLTGSITQQKKLNEDKEGVNLICERINNENKALSSKLFYFDGGKSSDNSETLSIYANAEEETGSNGEEMVENLEESTNELNILEIVLKKIKNSTLDELLDECWRSREIKDPAKNSDKLRFKNTKTSEQLELLNQTIVKFPFKFPKKERIKLAKLINLDVTQIYKWYYDNNPNKRNKKLLKGI